MATVLEKLGARSKNGTGAKRAYIIKGATSESDALSALLASADVPASIGSFVRKQDEFEAEEIEGTDGYYFGTGSWVAPEAKVNNQKPTEFSITFDISAQTIRVTQSKSTVAKYARPGKTARDFKGAINVQSDNTVEGVEMVVPALSYQNTYTFADDDITEAYIATLMGIVGKVNSGTFGAFAAGVLLLMSVRGQRRVAVDDDGESEIVWDLTFSFSALENKTGLSVGAITGIAKKGWEYLWIFYKEEEVDAGGGVKYVHKTPVSAYVERIYDEADYGGLGI